MRPPVGLAGALRLVVQTVATQQRQYVSAQVSLLLNQPLPGAQQITVLLDLAIGLRHTPQQTVRIVLGQLRRIEVVRLHRLARAPGNARRRHHLARLTSLRQIPLQREPDVGRLLAQLQLDTAKVLASTIELSHQCLQGRTTLKAQDLPRKPIQC